MLSSVAHKTDIAAGSAEYPVHDGSRCAVSKGVLPVWAAHFLLFQPGFYLDLPGLSIRFVSGQAASYAS